MGGGIGGAHTDCAGTTPGFNGARNGIINPSHFVNRTQFWNRWLDDGGGGEASLW